MAYLAGLIILVVIRKSSVLYSISGIAPIFFDCSRGSVYVLDFRDVHDLPPL
jgi:hypothetical protein